MASKGAIRVAFEGQRSLAFGSISGTYAGVGTAFSNPIRMLEVQNLTDADLQFSVDGVNDHFVVAANQAKIYDFSSNKTSSTGLYIAEGDRIYVKTIETPTEKAVYVTAIYGEDE